MKKFIIGLMVLVLVNISLTVVSWRDIREKQDHIESSYVLKNDSLIRSIERREENINNWYRNNPDAEIDEIYWR
jgi:hypothetical protein